MFLYLSIFSIISYPPGRPRGESRDPVSSEMELFFMIGIGWKPLPVVTKNSILKLFFIIKPVWTVLRVEFYQSEKGLWLIISLHDNYFQNSKRENSVTYETTVVCKLWRKIARNFCYIHWNVRIKVTSKPTVFLYDKPFGLQWN